jgi:H+/Cl- antiporter ClcA
MPDETYKTAPQASGKRVLFICLVVGILFIALMYTGVRWDQATSGPPEPAVPLAPQR